jgi:hypothetical protein
MPTAASGSQRACTLTALQYAREGFLTMSVDNSTLLLGTPLLLLESNKI